MAVYYGKRGQDSYGSLIGILLLDFLAPFIPGDVGNASTYDYPVLYEPVRGLTFDMLLNQDPAALDLIKPAALRLQSQGVRAITADCGFFAVFQNEIAAALDIPVLLSSILQLRFTESILPPDKKTGVISAVGSNLQQHPELFESLGINFNRIVIGGMENEKYFPPFGIDESGELPYEQVEAEVVGKAKELIAKDPSVRCILLECSMMAPYAKAVQDAVALPVFDYITMINYASTAVRQRRYEGFM